MTYIVVLFYVWVWENNYKVKTMIKNYRLKAGLTQEKLAELLNISTRQLQRIEKDETKTTIAMLIKIKNMLNIPSEEMIKIFETNKKEPTFKK